MHGIEAKQGYFFFFALVEYAVTAPEKAAEPSHGQGRDHPFPEG